MRSDWVDPKKKIVYQRAIKELDEPLRKQLLAIIKGDDSQLTDDDIKFLGESLSKKIDMAKSSNYKKNSTREIGLYKSVCRTISNLYKRTSSDKIKNAIFKNAEIQNQVDQIVSRIDLTNASLENKNKIFHLIKKYDSYNKEFPSYSDVLGGPPQLASALEVKTFTQEVKDDIKEIIHLMPTSVNCTIAIKGGRNDVTPLAAACFNENIPIPIIQYLLEKIPEAYKTEITTVNGNKILLIDDLNINIGRGITQDRYDHIKAIFKNAEKQDQVSKIVSRIDLTNTSPEDKNKIFHFINKYDLYNRRYCIAPDELGGPPQLASALEAKSVTPEIEDDIKEIIRVMPDSINCTAASVRCRDDVTPLAVACYNENIPIPMIRFLFENIPDAYKTEVKVQGTKMSLIEDLKNCIDQGITRERYDAIKALFDEFAEKDI